MSTYLNDLDGREQDLQRNDEQALFAGFVSELRGRGRAPKTIGSYRSDWVGLNEWCEQNIGQPFTVSTVSVELVKQYVSFLSDQGMMPATINRKLVFTKRYVSWASNRGLVDGRLCESVRKIKPVPQGPRRPKGLSDMDLKRFLREVERRASPRDQAIVYTLLGTGLRVSELAELDMSQVINNGNRCTILVHDYRPHGTRIRRLTISGHAKRKLRQYLIYRGRSTGLVFLGERGPLTANAIQRIVRKYCGFAKVKVSPSTLRHTFANSFLASDGDVVALADLLGHESLETTRLYLTVDDAEDVHSDRQAHTRPVVLKGVSDLDI